MNGLGLARRIRETMTRDGIAPHRSYTWAGKAHASDMVTWYGMALNLAGWDFCDECANEHPELNMIRPEPDADCCVCRWCFDAATAEKQAEYKGMTA